MPDMLREVQVKVLHENICGKMLSGYPWDRKTDTMLCAGGEDKVRYSKAYPNNMMTICHRIQIDTLNNSSPLCSGRVSRRLRRSPGVSDGGRGPVPGRGCQLGRGLCHRGDPGRLHQREEIQRVDQGEDRAARQQ